MLDHKQPRKLFVQPVMALDDAAGVVYKDYPPSAHGMVLPPAAALRNSRAVSGPAGPAAAPDQRRVLPGRANLGTSGHGFRARTRARREHAARCCLGRAGVRLLPALLS